MIVREILLVEWGTRPFDYFNDAKDTLRWLRGRISAAATPAERNAVQGVYDNLLRGYQDWCNPLGVLARPIREGREGQPVAKAVIPEQEEIDRLAGMLAKVGICARCGEEIQHDMGEPFAYCGCGASEWAGRYAGLPLLSRLRYEALLAGVRLPSLEEEEPDWPPSGAGAGPDRGDGDPEALPQG